MNSLALSLTNLQCELLLPRKIHCDCERQLVEINTFTSAGRRLSGGEDKFCLKLKYYSKKALNPQTPRERLLLFYFSWKHVIRVIVSRKLFCCYHVAASFAGVQPSWAIVIPTDVRS